MSAPVGGSDVGTGVEDIAAAAAGIDTGAGMDVAAGGAATMFFANIPQVLVAYLGPTPGLLGIGTPPMPQQTVLPYLLITPITASDNYITANTMVDLDLFAADPSQADDLGRVVHSRMLLLRNTTVTVGGFVVPIGHVKTDSQFCWRNYQNPDLHRVLATYTITSSFNAQPL